MASTIVQRQTFRTTGSAPERDGETFFLASTPLPGVPGVSWQITFRDGTHVMAWADEIFLARVPRQGGGA